MNQKVKMRSAPNSVDSAMGPIVSSSTSVETIQNHPSPKSWHTTTHHPLKSINFVEDDQRSKFNDSPRDVINLTIMSQSALLRRQ
jgi:hypothetical protein